MGADAYARKLAAQARRFAPVRSELVDGINRILRYVTWAIAPVAVLLLISQLHGHRTLREAAVGTVAALVGMVLRMPADRTATRCTHTEALRCF